MFLKFLRLPFVGFSLELFPYIKCDDLYQFLIMHSSIRQPILALSLPGLARLPLLLIEQHTTSIIVSATSRNLLTHTALIRWKELYLAYMARGLLTES